MLTMKRIPVPEWAKPFAVIVNEGFGEQEYTRLSSHYDTMLENVQQAVEQYVNGDQRTADGSERAETEDEDFVPDRTRLVREYYIAWEYYYAVRTIYPEEGLFRRRQPSELHHYVSVMVHCLGTPQTETQRACDYLGLNVWFRWHPKQQVLSSVDGITPTQIE